MARKVTGALVKSSLLKHSGDQENRSYMDSLWYFLKFIFIILILHMCGYVNVNAGVNRRQRHWIILEVELEAVVLALCKSTCP